MDQIKREPGFIVTEDIQLEEFRTDKAPLALAIVTGVVFVAAERKIAIMCLTPKVGSAIGCGKNNTS